MSTVADFNRIEDCDKIDAKCIDGYVEVKLNEENPNLLEIDTSWGSPIVDLSPAIKTEETLTTLYLSPETSPNCLVYEPERGENICIHGDDLSRIISMQRLKDVNQSTTMLSGDVYIYNETTQMFEPFDLATTLNNINTAITNINAAITSLRNRVTTIEEKLTPPEGAPNDVKVAFGTINLYSDHNAAIDDSGAITSLDKTHGLYTHNLNTNAPEDEIFG